MISPYLFNRLSCKKLHSVVKFILAVVRDSIINAFEVGKELEQWRSVKHVANQRFLGITAAFRSGQPTGLFAPICSG
jgi:hypothetical protein